MTRWGLLARSTSKNITYLIPIIKYIFKHLRVLKVLKLAVFFYKNLQTFLKCYFSTPKDLKNSRRNFIAKTPAKPIANVFQIWSTLVGYEEL